MLVLNELHIPANDHGDLIHKPSCSQAEDLNYLPPALSHTADLKAHDSQANRVEPADNPALPSLLHWAIPITNYGLYGRW
jgi:hypothetical protein